MNINDNNDTRNNCTLETYVSLMKQKDSKNKKRNFRNSFITANPNS